jgi:mycofactocin precursor peptide peptidase
MTKPLPDRGRPNQPSSARGRPNQPPSQRGRPNPPIAPERTTADGAAPERTTADGAAPERTTADGAAPERTTATAARLADATWPEVEARVAAGSATLLIPLGATEQHGPHLPLGTDSAIAAALAEAAAAHLPDAFVAPLVPYGSSGEHQDFPGTLSIGAEATELLLVELGRSASETFDRILFVNAHGGNAAPLAAAVERLRHEGRNARAWSPRFGGDAHAGRTETSLLLALDGARKCGRPDVHAAERGRPRVRLPDERTTVDPGPDERTTTVRMAFAEAGNTAPLPELIDDLRAHGVRAVAPTGVLGDPTGATAERGRALLEAAVDDLCATVRAWAAPRKAAASGMGAR